MLANTVILHNVYDMTAVLRDMIAEGFEVRPEDIATLSPYITSHIERFGEYTLLEQAPDLARIARWEVPTRIAPVEREEAAWITRYRPLPVFTHISMLLANIRPRQAARRESNGSMPEDAPPTRRQVG